MCDSFPMTSDRSLAACCPETLCDFCFLHVRVLSLHAISKVSELPTLTSGTSVAQGQGKRDPSMQGRVRSPAFSPADVIRT